MQQRMTGLYLGKKGLDHVTIFGHSSLGVPGIEIIGLGPYSRVMKEKFIFLCRSTKIRLPSKRYILGVEEYESPLTLTLSQASWLELPLFLCLLGLAGQLKIFQLDDCVTSGRMSVTGQIQQLKVPMDFIFHLQEQFRIKKMKHLKMITTEDLSLGPEVFTFKTQDLLEHSFYSVMTIDPGISNRFNARVYDNIRFT